MNWNDATPLQRLGLWLSTNLGLPDEPTEQEVDNALDALGGTTIGQQIEELR